MFCDDIFFAFFVANIILEAKNHQNKSKICIYINNLKLHYNGNHACTLFIIDFDEKKNSFKNKITFHL